MRILVSLTLAFSLAACSSSSDSGDETPSTETDTGACGIDGQKQFVLDNLYAWYLWNDLLPSNISIDDYAGPEELVDTVTLQFGPQDANGNPVDRFSSVGSAQADAEFFGEGRYEGFGFSYRFDMPNEPRLSRVFSDSPAADGGLQRGQTIVRLDDRSIADITANEGISAALDKDTVVFEMRQVDGSLFSVPIARGIVTIDPVPQWRIIDAGNGIRIGYIELAQFISTAEPEFEAVFSQFVAAGVDDVIIDLRYNGGGLVRTANLLGDYLGAFANDARVFSETRFNADRAPDNNSTQLFARQANSVDLGRLVVIATRGTASASELVANSLDAWFDVTIVGGNTFGKPIGQIGLTFCDKILRPTSFQTVNAAGEGDYFDGLPVDCPATDDLDFAVGADDDPNMVAAMTYLNTGACPAAALSGQQQKATAPASVEWRDRRGPPHREFSDAH